MLDLLFVAVGVLFFVVAILYVFGCDWLVKEEKTNLGGYVKTTLDKAEN
ncbi:MAG: hypothetical protein HXX08_07015 [Chloroflexi bacterium]|uniref:Uncharacterized protein n=1 Tax=Candidatus Chlorohelix allophototropha TaxID=3003348 RepID=A0A8T7LZ85_9CHLR|nr:hypothetical protein [Chloroflexota bacterium]WJW67485.1 hypothetical protein OZ401_000751 [Chloroflexota bacterium L227-S17]